MKKVLLIIAVMITAALLAACASGEPKQSEHTHEFGAWEAVKEPTCTEAGAKERICSCGEKEQEELPAAGHKFGEWEIAEEATVAAEGLQERTCSVCGEKEQEVIPQKEVKLETEDFKLNAIYIDESFDENGQSLLYLFYTLAPKTKNLTASQLLVNLNANNANVYKPVTEKAYIPYFTAYYYSSYNEDVFVGSSLDVCQTYKVASGDLSEGKVIRLESDSVDVDGIEFTVNEMIRKSNIEEIAKELDPDVYERKHAQYDAMMADVDSAVDKAVKNGINGYYWYFYAYPASYTLEFDSPNSFTIKSMGLTNSGTYTVHAGCIVLYYPSNGEEIVIPFTCNEDGSPAFDSNGSIMMPTLADQFVVYANYDGRD